MFQIQPLAADRFAHLYGLSNDVLQARGVVAQIADSQPGFPCRVTLAHAAPGQRVLLLNHLHQPADTPFRASHGIYVIDGADTVRLAPGELPDVFTRPSMLSVRAFGDDGMLKLARLCTGEECGDIFNALLDRDDTDYLHVHFAAYGCYAARVVSA